MKNQQVSLFLNAIIISFTLLLLSTVAQSSDKSDHVGWEKDSEYNKYYNYKERDSIKGKVVSFKTTTPLPGMTPGTAFVFKEGDEKFLVHLCPSSFASAKETGIRKGVKTKIKGCWALIDGEDVFLAAKVKQGENFEFKVRLTKDGTPFWSMSPEELAKEKTSQ